jgi:hypothetical protein
MKKYTLYPLLLSLLLLSCLEQVDVPLRLEREKLVVEGLLTNETRPFLRLSLTTQVGTAADIVPLKGAYVEVGTSGERTVFRAVPGEVGLYRPENPTFAGVAGRAYSLSIKLADGREYRAAPQPLPAPVPIARLTTAFEQPGQHGLQTYLDVNDPASTQNYYRWTARGYHQRRSTGVPTGFGSICCDRCWVLKEEGVVNVLSDALINGSTIRQRPVFFSPFYTLGRHLIEVQQYSLSQETYLYWNRYRDQQQRTGSIFDPLPAPLLGNVVNINDPQDIALGYFEVSGISRLRTEAVANTQADVAIFYNNESYIPRGDCMLAFPFAVYNTETPPGW